MIKSTCNRGFQLTFVNGLEISVQFGVGNYCSNRRKNLNEYQKDGIVESETAEIAVYDTAGKNVTKLVFPDKGDGMYIGWIKSDEIADMIQVVKNYKLAQ